jgi:hypothetical protein
MRFLFLRKRHGSSASSLFWLTQIDYSKLLWFQSVLRTFDY